VGDALALNLSNYQNFCSGSFSAIKAKASPASELLPDIWSVRRRLLCSTSMPLIEYRYAPPPTLAGGAVAFIRFSLRLHACSHALPPPKKIPPAVHRPIQPSIPPKMRKWKFGHGGEIHPDQRHIESSIQTPRLVGLA
jgi:hypothetical protein